MASGKGLWSAGLSLGLLALVALGCDFIQSTQANRVLAASILATPEYDYSQAVLSLDAGLPVPDGGLKLPGATVVQAFFGEAPKSSTVQPKGIAGATVSIEYSGKRLSLADKGAGNYLLTSVDDPAPMYKLTVAASSQTYTAEVTAPTSEDSAIETFHILPSQPPIELAAGQDLQLTRRSTDRVAVTAVFAIDPSSGATKSPTYTDLPANAMNLLDLILNDAKWRQKVITIPGKAAFPTPNTYYLVTVTAVDRGSTSSNLFTASVFLAGTPDIGLVKTK